MDPSCSLPFKVGQQAESKSFQNGYRGAWFRCNIRDMTRKKGKVKYELEYFDYPDDNAKWLKLYQSPHRGPTKRRKELKLQLMLRPSFPSYYRESEAPNLHNISETVVIVRDFWKVGDMVDWFCQGCFWTGRIARILEEDKLQVELLPPPEGEGSTYEVASTNLRPSLHWSPELGWIVPHPKGRCSSLCARLVQPCKQDEPTGPTLCMKKNTISCCEAESSISSNRPPGSSLSIGALEPLDEEGKEKNPLLDVDQVDTNIKSDASNSSAVSPGLVLPLVGSSQCDVPSPRQIVELTGQGIELEVSSCPQVTQDDNVEATRKDSKDLQGTRENGAVSCSHGVMDSSIAGNEKSLQEDFHSSGVAIKKARTSKGGQINTVVRDGSIESSVMELEELANKMRWLRGLLKFGAHRPDVKRSTWKFHESCQLHKP